MVQIAVAVTLTLAIALYFWIDSRYPSLLKKLHAGTSIHTSGVLSFDALWPVTASMPVTKRIERTTVNWMWTNRIGMSFGIFFGAGLLTLLPTLGKRRFRSRAANTLMGTVAGVPLGVCANCVAPIGQSLFESGASANTALATMISSPTLNVVVLTMVFTLFPLPVAIVRLLVPLALLALLTWLVRDERPSAATCDLNIAEGWLSPATFTLKRYLRNLGRLALATVPLMIVAAILGAVVAELLPAQTIPSQVSILGIVLVALIGTFLPVPVAFDVAAAFLLMSRGVPLPYVVTLLCTLGITSIYPFFIVGRAISWRTAATVFIAVIALGIATGLGTALVMHRL
jgi:uncharacterized membrane protein YraQ (UPF0718 family)